jgi:hypothetical protein
MVGDAQKVPLSDPKDRAPTILVVDDEVLIRMAVFLRKPYDLEYVVAHNVTEALQHTPVLPDPARDNAQGRDGWAIHRKKVESALATRVFSVGLALRLSFNPRRTSGWCSSELPMPTLISILKPLSA